MVVRFIAIDAVVAMGGVRENLARLTEARVRGDAIVRARNAEEVPLATAVGLIARERLTGEAPPRAALSGLKLIAPWIEDKAASELDALAMALDDQAAFARLSRRLLEDLDLAAATDPTQEEPEEGGEEEEGDQGGTEEATDDSGESTPSGGDVEARGEESDEGDSDSRESDQAEAGEQEAMARPMLWLSKATAPFVWLLDHTSALIFRALGMNRESRNHVTAEELHLVVAEAQTAGVLEESERAIISGIVRLADRPVREVMTPRM